MSLICPALLPLSYSKKKNHFFTYRDNLRFKSIEVVHSVPEATASNLSSSLGLNLDQEFFHVIVQLPALHKSLSVQCTPEKHLAFQDRVRVVCPEKIAD